MVRTMYDAVRVVKEIGDVREEVLALSSSHTVLVKCLDITSSRFRRQCR